MRNQIANHQLKLIASFVVLYGLAFLPTSAVAQGRRFSSPDKCGVPFYWVRGKTEFSPISLNETGAKPRKLSVANRSCLFELV